MGIPSLLAALLSLAATALLTGCEKPRPVVHSAYLWQRDWSRIESLDQALAQATPNLERLLVLAGESSAVGFARPAMPEILRTAKPLPVLRIGTHLATLPPTEQLARVRSWIAEIETDLPGPSEIQLDFDCPTSRLGDYAQLVEALESEGRPISITALPTWLASPDFVRLASACSRGFVLQVHSLELPAPESTAARLFDRSSALAAARKADRLGLPFSLALPTYSCLVCRDADGAVLDVISEDLSRPPPGTVEVLRCESDPAELHALLEELREDPPSHLREILWFRLPLAEDRMNWTWPTLAALLRGELPHPDLLVALEESAPYRIVLRNGGTADAELPTIELTIPPAAGDAFSDGLMGYTAKTIPGSDRIHLVPPASTLRPGDRLEVGWLRLTNPLNAPPPARILPSPTTTDEP